MLNNLGKKLLKNVFSNIKLQHILKFTSTTIHDISSVQGPAIKNNELNHLHNQLLGQPTSWTHPHLLNDGEITPKIKLNEYKKRRSDLMELIKKSSNNTAIKNHMIVIPSATKQYMSGHIPYVFRQNTDFNYFTGCQEPDSMLIMTIDKNDIIKTIMLMRPKDTYAELWDGPRTGIDNSIIYFGIDHSLNISNLKNIFEYDILKEFLQSPIILWYDQLTNNHEEYFIGNKINQNIIHNNQLHNPTKFIHKLRVIKSINEMELMRKTCEIASESINEVMNETKINDSEHHIFARIDYKCRMRNADFLAYPPVVASGKNATSIHYISNNQLIKNNDLILMDAGCDFGGYCSDITRTWPVNGEFTNAQKTLYDVILVLQKELISKILTEYGQNLDQMFEYTCYKLGLYLQEIGLIPKHLNGTELSRAGYSFCPHHVSHYLGMDVHDTPTFSRSEKIQPGMVFTVEPGIYIPANCKTVPEEFRGIGIRIEDDILVTSNGSIEVLTEKCVKNIDDIRNQIKK